MNPDEGYVDANHIRLHYLLWRTAAPRHAALPPIVLLHATDPFPSLMAQLAQRIPGARLETVADAGHLAPMERPEALAEAILAFSGERA